MEEDKQPEASDQKPIEVVNTPESKDSNNKEGLSNQPSSSATRGQQPNPVPTGVQSPATAIASNENQQFASSDLPEEVKRWNWGAFFFTWIWGIGNGVLISLIALIPAASLIMAIVLGIKGGEWAWQTGRFASIEEYQKKQKAWAIWGLVFFILSLVANIGVFVLMVLTS